MSDHHRITINNSRTREASSCVQNNCPRSIIETSNIGNMHYVEINHHATKPMKNIFDHVLWKNNLNCSHQMSIRKSYQWKSGSHIRILEVWSQPPHAIWYVTIGSSVGTCALWIRVHDNSIISIKPHKICIQHKKILILNIKRLLAQK